MILLAAFLGAAALWISGSHSAPRLESWQQRRPREPPAWWLRISTKLRGSAIPPEQLAAELELYLACVRAGLAPQQAVATVADAATQGSTRGSTQGSTQGSARGSTQAWMRTASMLALGMSAQQAWAPLAGLKGLEEVTTVAHASARTGASMEPGLSSIAQQLRAGAKAHATAAAERAGVLIALPLTLCFLPAFFTLGLAPVLLALASEILNNH
ncbi:type II secretion system F family protein [Corynebacterium pseudopelargi]|uniref:Type II secretion system protein GspF domain-containing protein n=1 Tax=Corynebacterium pseudopelargi TaxID=2080757 RepID=A0A3G6J1D0_9CORY|nr:type II secretion system F family protein [Corynebacterium pseudopelargi]AZA10170.1 hypothetical protein CPPEL_10360 [Corynebacterium pseudopelargi]